jgi:hypothetical protein
MDGVTEAVLKSISAVTTLADTFDSVEESVENFDAGPDSMAGIDFYDGAIETMQEMMDNYEYGNPQLERYLESFYGVDFEVSEKDFINNIQKSFSKMKNYLKNDGMNFWIEVAKEN